MGVKPGLVQPSSNAGLINGMAPQNIKEREAYQQQMAAGERSMFEPPQGLVPPAVGGGLLAQPGSPHYKATLRQQEIVDDFMLDGYKQKGDYIPRTMRNNNPAALSKVGIKWDGRSANQDDMKLPSEDSPMQQFDNPLMGARAAVRNFRTKFRRGNNTIQGIVSEHLGSQRPVSENNSLVKSITKRMDIGATVPLDLESDSQMKKFLEGIVLHESGGEGKAHFIDSGILETGLWMESNPAEAESPPQNLGL
tara:strand:- start:336 stop:1088 length:753 start_codon:yes stop_codon:yes gene_type:complete